MKVKYITLFRFYDAEFEDFAKARVSREIANITRRLAAYKIKAEGEPRITTIHMLENDAVKLTQIYQGGRLNFLCARCVEFIDKVITRFVNGITKAI